MILREFRSVRAVCDCHGSGDGDRGGMDDGDQGGTVVAQRTSGLYSEAGDGDHGGGPLQHLCWPPTDQERERARSLGNFGQVNSGHEGCTADRQSAASRDRECTRQQARAKGVAASRFDTSTPHIDSQVGRAVLQELLPSSCVSTLRAWPPSRLCCVCATLLQRASWHDIVRS